MIPSDVLAARLERVRTLPGRGGVDALVVTHLPNLRYVTGFDGSAGAAVLSQNGATLVVDGRYAEAAAAIPAVGAGLVQLVVAPRTGTLEDEVVGALRAAGVRRAGFEADHLTVRGYETLQRLASAAPSIALVPSPGVIEAARARKDAYEVSVLREAAQRASAVLTGVLADLRPGIREWDVAAQLEAGLRRAGFARTAFDTIVAAGPNAARPHHRASDRRIEGGDLVLLDFGGVYNGYCADLSRTVAIGAPPPEALRLHAAVRRAQEAALGAIREGARPEDVDAAARQVLTAAGLGDAFTHSTGHGLGLEAHERPRLGPARTGESSEPEPALAEGMVVTVEPGAYVPGFGGVRIEDEVLVTSGGCDILTTVGRELTLVDG